MKISIGTRGSKLALWQAYYVADLLKNGGIETEIKIITTKGDKILDKALSKIGSKGVFTEELEEQLRTKQIDIAVHSAKDVQSTLDDDLELIAFTEREEVNDVLVSFDRDLSLNNWPEGAIIGTSSTRRVAMLKKYYPQIATADVRGNLQTRLEKLRKGNYHALILAYAGVHRMEYDRYIAERLPTTTFTPAVGQGSVALEAAKDMDAEKKEQIRQWINHAATEVCLSAERAFLKTLQGGCSIPVFGLARLKEEELTLQTGIVSLDGKQMLRESQTGSEENPVKLGQETAKKLLEKGGKEILEEIKKGL